MLCSVNLAGCKQGGVGSPCLVRQRARLHRQDARVCPWAPLPFPQSHPSLEPRLPDRGSSSSPVSTQLDRSGLSALLRYAEEWDYSCCGSGCLGRLLTWDLGPEGGGQEVGCLRMWPQGGGTDMLGGGWGCLLQLQ